MSRARRAVVAVTSNRIGVIALATIIVAPPIAMSISSNKRPKMARKFAFSSLKKIFPVSTLLIEK
mgnify:CR=1 FL=1